MLPVSRRFFPPAIRPDSPVSGRPRSQTAFAPAAAAVVFLLVSVCLGSAAAVAADEAVQPPQDDPAGAAFRELRNLHRLNPAKAVEGFRDFLTRFGESDWADDAQYWLAMSLEKSRAEKREVIAAYRVLLDKHPRSSYHDDALFAIAEVWRRAPRPESLTQAVRAYTEFIEQCPQSERLSEAKFKMGEIYRLLKDDEKAAGYFLRVVQEHPKSSFSTPAHMQLASLYLKVQRTDDALAIYARLLASDLPDNQRIAAQLGTVDCHLSRKDGLEQALKTCREIREEAAARKTLEDYAEYKTREKMASHYLRQKEYDKAEGQYGEYIGGFGASVGAWQARLNVGSIRIAAGNPAGAREMFQAIISHHAVVRQDVPWYVTKAMYLEAYTYELEKNWAESRRLYDKLIETHPGSGDGQKARRHLADLDKREAAKPAQPVQK
jgi:TolA-binding protein